MKFIMCFVMSYIMLLLCAMHFNHVVSCHGVLSMCHNMWCHILSCCVMLYKVRITMLSFMSTCVSWIMCVQ